jgi:transcriptional regulator with XRE-family HTH domain
MDIKENLATNLVQFRKSANLTQAELAEKLNYSDKAVSKWERGEAVPDITILKQLADYYGVTIDALISTPKKENKLDLMAKNKGKIRQIIGILSTCMVWLVALTAFILLNNIFPLVKFTWLAFIYAIPISAIVLLVLSSVWKKKITTAIIISLLIWSVILALYLSLLFMLTNPPGALWQLFLIGIPLQILTIFWTKYRRIN